MMFVRPPGIAYAVFLSDAMYFLSGEYHKWGKTTPKSDTEAPIARLKSQKA
jgi:hypothetical protein